MNSEEILNLIKSRRSIYPPQYNGGEISKSEIDMLLEAAHWAPTHKHTQPWRFIVLGGERKQSLADFISEDYAAKFGFDVKKVPKVKGKIAGADKVILLAYQKDLQQRIAEWEELASLAMAVQNMWLLCGSLNIGAYWSSPSFVEGLHEFLPHDEGVKYKGMFLMGKVDPALHIEGNRDSINDNVKWYL